MGGWGSGNVVVSSLSLSLSLSPTRRSAFAPVPFALLVYREAGEGAKSKRFPSRSLNLEKRGSHESGVRNQLCTFRSCQNIFTSSDLDGEDIHKILFLNLSRMAIMRSHVLMERDD